MSTWSAPGKTMLFGEYAVLEGHRSLALCWNRRIRCSAEPHTSLRIEAPGVFEPAELPVEALEAPCAVDELTLLWPLLQAHGAGVLLRFEADFPPAWGLGSSSASTLAAAAALGLATEPMELLQLVIEAQMALQGNASGYDAATQLLGGAVAYRREPRELQPARPGAEHRWVVAWTGRKASTASMIRRVREVHPPGDTIYARIGAVAEQGIAAFKGDDPRALGAALNIGQGLLDELGAVPDELGAIVTALQADPGVLGARMTGAGGGDSVLILADDVACAAEAARRHGLEILDLAYEAEGLREEA